MILANDPKTYCYKINHKYELEKLYCQILLYCKVDIEKCLLDCKDKTLQHIFDQIQTIYRQNTNNLSTKSWYTLAYRSQAQKSFLIKN